MFTPARRMKLYLVTAVLILAQSVLAQNAIVNINNQTDQALSQINKFLTERGFGLYPLRPIDNEYIQTQEGVVVGLNSQYRIGDATINQANNATSVDLHLGLRLFTFAFGKIDSFNASFSAVYRVRNNSFHIAYTVLSEHGCRVNLTSYEYEELSGATVSTSLSGIDEIDVSEIFTDYVLPQINAVIARKKHRVEKAFEYLICRRPHLHHNHEYLQHLLAEVFVSHLEP